MIKQMADFFLEKRANAVLVAVTGFLASAAGLFFYWPQLMETQPLLWMFVIDCPLYVSLFSIVVVLNLMGKVFSFLNFAVSVGIIKYGIWTISVLGFYPETYMSDMPMYIFLIASHILMILAGIILLNYVRAGLKSMTGVTAWFLLNDFVDYSMGTLPRIPENHTPEIMAISVFSSVLIPLLIFWKGRNPGIQS